MTLSRLKDRKSRRTNSRAGIGPWLLAGVAGLLVLAQITQEAPLSEDVCFLFGWVGWSVVYLNAQRIIDSNAFLSYTVAALLFAGAQAVTGTEGTGLARAVFMLSPIAAIGLLRASLACFFPNAAKPVIILGRSSWKGAPHYKPSMRERLFSLCQLIGMILWGIVGKVLL